MSWNNRLYFYAKKKDAVYLGGMDGRKNLWTGIDGVVLLEQCCRNHIRSNKYDFSFQKYA